MENQFTEQMTKLTDVELLEIISHKRNDYQAQALLAAEHELSKRNLLPEQIQRLNIEIEQTKQVDIARASSPLEPTWRALSFIFPCAIPLIFSGILKSEGYDKKAKELFLWTFYGIGFYIGLIMLLTIVSKI